MIIKENELIEEFRDLSVTGEFIPSAVRITIVRDHKWFIIERKKNSDWTVAFHTNDNAGERSDWILHSL
jgi:hypothetical protein